MKVFMTTVSAGVLLASTTYLTADAKIQKVVYPVGAEATISTTATVESVNKDKREVTLKKSDGSKETIKVPEAVRNLDQVKVGDKVKAKYTESIALGIRKSDEAPSAIESKTLERAPLGSTPKGEVTSTTQVTANIEKINKKKREVTLLKPDGTKQVVVVPEDVKSFDSLKKGDQVVVTATESLALEVVPK